MACSIAVFAVLCGLALGWIAFLDWRDGPVSAQKAGTAHIGKEAKAVIESAFGVTPKLGAAVAPSEQFDAYAADINRLVLDDAYRSFDMSHLGEPSAEALAASIVTPAHSLRISVPWADATETGDWLDELDAVGREAGYRVQIDDVPQSNRVIDPDWRVTVTMRGVTAEPADVIRWLLFGQSVDGIEIAILNGIGGAVLGTVG